MSKNTESRLVNLWCPVCKEQVPHRVPAVGEPRCLECEERSGVSLPPPEPKKPEGLMYPIA